MTIDSLKPDQINIDILEKVRQTIRLYSMINKGDKVIVGVSGGMDSMSLLDVFLCLQKEYDLQLVIAHMHHGLRGAEADREYIFVEKFAKNIDIPFEGKRIKPEDYNNNSNIQAQARTYRYRFYESVAEKRASKKIATGHHQDDHIETLLLQIFRGTGSLIGIQPIREGRYIRPLFDLCREEIQAYLKKRKIPYCEDSSNQKRTYLRNRIRSDLIPWLEKEVNPSFSASLLRFAGILGEEKKYFEDIARAELKKIKDPSSSDTEVTLIRERLEQRPIALQRHILRQAYKELVGSTFGLSLIHLQGISRALREKENRPQKVFPLPKNVQLFIEYDFVRLSCLDLWEQTPYNYPFSLGDNLDIVEAGITLHTSLLPIDSVSTLKNTNRYQAHIDVNCFTERMCIRNFRAGDRFRPLGLGGEKKIKDFFIDQKIAKSRRHRMPLLIIDGKIAWVIGYRIDERFKITKKTKKCMQIEIFTALDGKEELFS